MSVLPIARVYDRIRYDCLVDRRITKMRLEIVWLILNVSEKWFSPQQWGHKFVAKLRNITQKQ